MMRRGNDDMCSDDDESDDDEEGFIDYLHEQQVVIVDEPDKRWSPASDNRKLAKRISTQIKLNRCRTTSCIVMSILSNIVIFNNFVYIGCYRCLKWVKHEDVCHYGRELLCSSCRENVSKQIEEERATCEYCNSKIKPGERISLYVYDDCAPVGMREFRMADFCNKHGMLQWVKTNHVMSKARIIAEMKRGTGRLDTVTGRYVHAYGVDNSMWIKNE